jgi:serine/threonine-protein kinase
MLAERYRIVGLLGKGGMGEVYRADDLKLGVPVALKFLPASLERDPSFLERFHGEVRIARQVSHPSVCRVYDVDEFGGRHFLSMEYVDGEDLATLLRRIGRLPGAKALEIARQLCAGLAAAHAQGVLHRDLKPSNIMLDGHGRARITDFGLAVPAGDSSVREVSGTPAYMAPEQLAGRGASVQSDLYSLGLVLYEIFTGKRAYAATTIPDLRALHETLQIAPPSSHAPDVDPAAERAILRCLEKEPVRRPASALQLAGSLPGGDPLAAALAAGETPSPEMVAAAGEEGALTPAKAWGLLALVVALVGTILTLNNVATMVGLVKPQKSPEVLNARAAEIVKKLGYDDAPADLDGFFFQDSQHQRWRMNKLPPKEQVRGLEKLDPPLVYYYYRQSPRGLATLGMGGVVTSIDPPPTTPGMISVILDPQGRLQFLRVQATNYEQEPRATGQPVAEAHWSAVFAEAGLELRNFTPVASPWTPQVPYDARLGWEGTLGSYPNEKFQISAASFGGKPVWFSIEAPWTPVPGQAPATQSASRVILLALNMAIVLGLMFGCAYFARRNVAAGRGDRKGAFRIMVAVIVVGVLDWASGTHFTGDVNVTFNRFMDNTGIAVFKGVFLYMIYLALEPFIRRRMPHLLISWSRLLGGGLRDPLVGRDVLLGMACGSALVAFTHASLALPWWFDVSGVQPLAVGRFSLDGLAGSFSVICALADRAIINSLAMLGVFFLLHVILRNKWLAAGVLGVVMALLFSTESANAGMLVAIGVVMGSLLTFVLLRLGQLAFLATWFTLLVLNNFPLPLDLARWYGANLALALAVLLGLLGFAFHASLGGRPLLGAALAED